jgi:hypothetical protein
MNYKITVEVDQQWYEILGQISKHQRGFVWLDVELVDQK